MYRYTGRSLLNYRLIDPYKYSSVFMREIQCYLKENPRKDLDSIIKEAFERTQEPGGVCCLLMSLNPDTMTLMSYILGDCGYAILRKDDKNGLLKVIHKSKEKSKFFNKSPQITKETDFFSYSQYSQHQMLENDFIISGSDGLFDNLYDWDILDCIKPFIQEYERILDLELVAEIIAKLALKKSKEINYKSPFSEQAKDYYFDYIGGKMDDITVIVSQISS